MFVAIELVPGIQVNLQDSFATNTHCRIYLLFFLLTCFTKNSQVFASFAGSFCFFVTVFNDLVQYTPVFYRFQTVRIFEYFMGILIEACIKVHKISNFSDFFTSVV